MLYVYILIDVSKEEEIIVMRTTGGEGCVQGGHTASQPDKMTEERKSQCAGAKLWPAAV